MHWNGSQRIAGRAQGKLGLAVACLGLATGCTILMPVQTPQADRRFPLSSPTRTGTKPCTPPPNATTKGECELLQDDIDAFHGGLGRALWETDVRRRELLGQAAMHTNINSAYNALLWPLGAYFIERKIRKPEWRTLDVAAVAAASYGFLTSGIPDRDLLYVKTAVRMACSMAVFDADLYLEGEIKPATPDSKAKPPDGPGDSFVDRLNALSLATQEFVLARDKVLVEVELQPHKAASSGLTPADKARLQAKGLNSSPKAQKDPTKDFVFETETLLAKAQEQFGAALELKQQLDNAGTRLRRQRITIEAALTQGLNERTPALQQPTAVATQIAQAFEAGMVSERKFVARVKQEAGTGRTEDWLPTQALLADLTKESRSSMIGFWTSDRVKLKRAMARLAEWTASHDERQRVAKADASSMGCSDGDLSEFTRSLSKAAEGAGASTPTPPASAASK